MTTLPNLSAWHPVPIGATIPAGPWPHTPRRAMDPDAAAALDAIGLGCTAEPRRAR